jgi:succinate dehydrogenase/fumarate reductase flavoprotein subunit
MPQLEGELIETDVLVIGGGISGLVAALSTKRHAGAGIRVSIADSWMIGRTGHAAFSNADMVVVEPDDDLDAVALEIIAGNDGIADQLLVRDVLAMSYARLRDLEALGVIFPKEQNNRYVRRPTRGLDAARLILPDGGGMELCWRLRCALEAEGVQLLDRIFITGLMRPNGRVAGAVGLHSRSGAFHVLSARATIICTNAVTFRPGFARDITGTGTLLAYSAGAVLRNAEFSYTRPGTPKFYFEGITYAIQEGAYFVDAKGERFMLRHEPLWGDEADVPRIARAMAMERQRGNDEFYLDMSRVPEHVRSYFIEGKAKWMSYFYAKLGTEARTDMFAKTPYYPLNQMTKMGVRTDHACRSDVPGLLMAGLAQGGCANHFAGFHIGMCIGTGWIAGRSAAEDLDCATLPTLDAPEIGALHKSAFARSSDSGKAESDHVLRRLQELMFACDVTVWKHADRLRSALVRLDHLREHAQSLTAPHIHELVRLRETEAMLLAAEIILKASVTRTESRLSHFREDYQERNDADWLCWVDVEPHPSGPQLVKTSIPTPLHPIEAAPHRSIKRAVKGAR